VPYFGYQRQDHIFREGEDVSVKMVAGILSRMELKEVISVDFHSVKIREAFSVPAVELSALPLFAKTIKENGLDESSFLVSPDMGGIRRIKILSELLGGMSYVVIEKNRDLVTGTVSADKFEGQIGKNAIIVDDMISSGGTIAVATELLIAQGVSSISVFATHAVFSKEAPKILQESGVNSVYVSDSVFVPIEKMFPKLEILSLSQVIADKLKS
jgi:ribose-phosphate pyrophosphokinase